MNTPTKAERVRQLLAEGMQPAAIRDTLKSEGIAVDTGYIRTVARRMKEGEKVSQEKTPSPLEMVQTAVLPDRETEFPPERTPNEKFKDFMDSIATYKPKKTFLVVGKNSDSEYTVHKNVFLLCREIPPGVVAGVLAELVARSDRKTRKVFQSVLRTLSIEPMLGDSTKELCRLVETYRLLVGTADFEPNPLESEEED